MHPLLICDHISVLLHKRYTYLLFTEAVSVIKPNKYSNLASKTL